jgi:hypothetical protein
LRAQEQGFAKPGDWLTERTKEQLKDSRDGKKVEGVDPNADIPIEGLITMHSLVKGSISRWIEAGATGEKPRLGLGSFIRGVGAGYHSKGKAVDINYLDFTETADRVIEILKDLPKGEYEIGLPFQGSFFPSTLNLDEMKKQAIENGKKKAAPAQPPPAGPVPSPATTGAVPATPQPAAATPPPSDSAVVPSGAQLSGAVSSPSFAPTLPAPVPAPDPVHLAEGLKLSKTAIYSLTWNVERKQWEDVILSYNNAYTKLGSERLITKINTMTNAGFKLSVFPDNPGHLHVALIALHEASGS